MLIKDIQKKRRIQMLHVQKRETMLYKNNEDVKAFEKNNES